MNVHEKRFLKVIAGAVGLAVLGIAGTMFMFSGSDTPPPDTTKIVQKIDTKKILGTPAVPINKLDMGGQTSGFYKATIPTGSGEKLSCYAMTAENLDRSYDGLSCNIAALKGPLEFNKSAKWDIQKLSDYNIATLHPGLYNKVVDVNKDGKPVSCMFSLAWGTSDHGDSALTCDFRAPDPSQPAVDPVQARNSAAVKLANTLDMSTLPVGVYKAAIPTKSGETLQCYSLTSVASERSYDGLSCNFNALKGPAEFSAKAKWDLKKVSDFNIATLAPGQIYKKIVDVDKDGNTNSCIVNFAWGSSNRGDSGLTCDFRPSAP